MSFDTFKIESTPLLLLKLRAHLSDQGVDVSKLDQNDQKDKLDLAGNTESEDSLNEETVCLEEGTVSKDLLQESQEVHHELDVD